MIKKGLTNLAKPQALPYVHPRGKALYVRVTYRDADGIQRSIEERIPVGAEIDDVLAMISRLKVQAGRSPAIFNPDKMTFGELRTEYQKAHPKTPAWYLAPMEYWMIESSRA